MWAEGLHKFKAKRELIALWNLQKQVSITVITAYRTGGTSLVPTNDSDLSDRHASRYSATTISGKKKGIEERKCG